MSFLRKLFKSAPVDPAVPLTHALSTAQALKAMPEMHGDQQKDRALVGLIGNLTAANGALATGKDEQGIPISRTAIADRLRRTQGYMKQHGIWSRLQSGAGKDARASLRLLDKQLTEAEKALRDS